MEVGHLCQFVVAFIVFAWIVSLLGNLQYESLCRCGLQDLRIAFLPSCFSQVRIALQMEDGSRLQGSFSCGQSLFEVVTHFSQIGSVCAHVDMPDVTRLNIICRLITAPKQWVGLRFQCASAAGSARKPVKIPSDFDFLFSSVFPLNRNKFYKMFDWNTCLC